MKTKQLRANSDVLEEITARANDIQMRLAAEDVDVYLFLFDRIRTSGGNITNDYTFQFLFRSYYRLDNAGLSKEFKSAYFELMRKCFNAQTTDVENICLELSKYKNLRNQNTVQFSFATKLVAMIDPELPLFDQYVGKLFGFNAPGYVPTVDGRLQKYVTFYDKLKESIRWLIQQREYHELQEILRNRLANWSKLSTTKQVDFVLWTAGKLMTGETKKQ